MDRRLTMFGACSGIGGFELGFRNAGFEIIGMSEIDPWCKRVLKKNFPGVKIYGDLRGIKGERITANVFACGFPCQPASSAGSRRGADDSRWVWSDIIRLVSESDFTWIVFENVYGLLSLEQGMVFEQCMVDLEAAGFEIQSFIIPACGIDAKHRRDRIFIVCHTEHVRRSSPEVSGFACSRSNNSAEGKIATEQSSGSDYESGNMGPGARIDADADSDRESQPERRVEEVGRRAVNIYQESIVEQKLFESRMGRNVHDGVPAWMDEPMIPRQIEKDDDLVNKIKGFGNAVLPQLAEVIARAIAEVENV